MSNECTLFLNNLYIFVCWGEVVMNSSKVKVGEGEGRGKGMK